MSNPIVSICIPTYNGDKYLVECLNSCVNQTFKDYEIIICDDGSSDKSISIIEEYVSKYGFIKFYKNEQNLGLVGNWNNCIELSSGKWIKFVFQDDFITHDCLQKFVNEIDESTQLIVCKRNFILDKIPTSEEREYYEVGVKTLENTGFYSSNRFSSDSICKIAIKHISLNFIGEPSLSFIKKEAFTKFGMFDGNLKQICDLEFLLRVASNSGLVYIPEQLCSFRIHSNSTTEKNMTGENYHQNYIEVLLYALMLLTKKEFLKFRNSLKWMELLKLKIFIKYRSYKAFKASTSSLTDIEYNKLYERYGSDFFKKMEAPFLKLLMIIKN